MKGCPLDISPVNFIEFHCSKGANRHGQPAKPLGRAATMPAIVWQLTAYPARERSPFDPVGIVE
jgi:hypothetical protein